MAEAASEAATLVGELCLRTSGKPSFYLDFVSKARRIVRLAKEDDATAFEAALDAFKTKTERTMHMEACLKYIFEKDHDRVQSILGGYKLGAELPELDLTRYQDAVDFGVSSCCADRTPVAGVYLRPAAQQIRDLVDLDDVQRTVVYFGLAAIVYYDKVDARIKTLRTFFQHMGQGVLSFLRIKHDGSKRMRFAHEVGGVSCRSELQMHY